MVWKDWYSDDIVHIMKKLKKKDPVQYKALCKKGMKFYRILFITKISDMI